MAKIVSYKMRQKSMREANVAAGQLSWMTHHNNKASLIIDDVVKARRFQMILSETEKRQLLDALQSGSGYALFAIEVEKSDAETRTEDR